jgi:hypothetical protein
MNRIAKLMLQCSLTVTILVALFWIGWYLVVGSVPVVNSIPFPLSETKTINLPFPLSRWWDILFASVWGCLMGVWVLFNGYKDKLWAELKDQGDYDAYQSFHILIIWFIISCAEGAVFSLPFGLGFGLIVTLGFFSAFLLFLILLDGVCKFVSFLLSSPLYRRFFDRAAVR